MNVATKVALVADDDPFFRIALTSILKDRLGFDEVVQTESLDEAIDQLADADGCIDIALFDLAMPGMESAASLKAVRDFYPDIKTAVVSSSKKRNDIISALSIGVHGYVPKGLGPDDLTDALQKILDGTIYVPPMLAAPEEEAETPTQADGDKYGNSEENKAILDGLTQRQRDVLELLVQGSMNKEIARKLDLSSGTVKIHIASLFKSLGVRNRSHAAVIGMKLLSSDGQ